MSSHKPSQTLPARFRLIFTLFLQRPGLSFADVLPEPEMVRREMWTCLLAYNLIRRAMLQSAREAGVLPRTLSFAAAVQTIGSSWILMSLGDDALAAPFIDAALASMAMHVVGHRPVRLEPRAIKRRPKEHALLTQPRAQATAELRKGKSM